MWGLALFLIILYTIPCMETLGKLFSSDALVKVMRLFLMNKTSPFELTDIIDRCQIRPDSARTEIKLLESIGFLRHKVFYKDIERPVKKTAHKSKKRQRSEDVAPKIIRKKCDGFTVNEFFPYIRALQALLIDNESVQKDELASRFRKTGRIKLLLVSGVFIQYDDKRLDLLIVGDNLKKKMIDDEVKKLEYELGCELAYAVFDTEEFKYRLDMYDKLICDVLEYPHEKIISSITIPKEIILGTS